MKMGRPPIYSPDLCEAVVDYGRQGMSRTEIASELDVSRETLYAWIRQHADFSDAMTRAKQEEQAWWERLAREHLTTPSEARFNERLWAKNMSARFRHEGWSDSVVVSGPDSGPITIQDETDTRAAARTLLLAFTCAVADSTIGEDR